MKRIDARRMAPALLIVACAVGLATALSGDTNTETQGTSAADDLTPELRSRVERLKVEAPVVSTDREELRRRLDTLWEWSTAAFRGGATMGPDFPSMWGVCHRSVRGSARPAVAPERISDFIARSVRELGIKDETPRAIGPLAAPEGPFVAGDFETVT